VEREIGIPDEHVTNIPYLGDVVEGWKSIAVAIGRSKWTAVKLSQREPQDDPLPVGRYLGRPFVKVVDLAAWLERQTTAEFEYCD
jgi:hypothetical protein